MARTQAWHIGELAEGCDLWGGEQQVRSQLGLTVPGTHVPSPEPTSFIVLLHAKKPSGPLPKLCRAAWGLLLTPPLQPHQ